MTFSTPSTLVVATLAAATVGGVQACTVHVFPNPGVYPLPSSSDRMYSFNGEDGICTWAYGVYAMQNNQWNHLECAGRASCKLANFKWCESVTANLPCDSYYIQLGEKRFCEAYIDVSTGKPRFYGQGPPICKESVVILPTPSVGNTTYEAHWN